MSKQRHPIQPVAEDADGVLRFKQNAIVRYLLDSGSIDLNDVARLNFSAEDRQQFAQLIGYSLHGYTDLSYVDDDAAEIALAMESASDERDVRITYLESKLAEVRLALREPIAALYGRHPDDIMEVKDEMP